MGEPNIRMGYYTVTVWTPGELKYLSSRGEEINLEIPLVATSERGQAQTTISVDIFCLCWGCRICAEVGC